jgi:hypothetical protein
VGIYGLEIIGYFMDLMKAFLVCVQYIELNGNPVIVGRFACIFLQVHYVGGVSSLVQACCFPRIGFFLQSCLQVNYVEVRTSGKSLFFSRLQYSGT